MAVKMLNKEKIENKVKALDFTLGVYDNDIEQLSQVDIKNVLASIRGDSTDIDVKIRGKIYVMEIAVVDDEIDFLLVTQNEYIERYGDERWDNE